MRYPQPHPSELMHSAFVVATVVSTLGLKNRIEEFVRFRGSAWANVETGFAALAVAVGAWNR